MSCIGIDFYCLHRTFTYIISLNPIKHNLNCSCKARVCHYWWQIFWMRERRGQVNRKDSKLPNKVLRIRAQRNGSLAESHSNEIWTVVTEVITVLCTSKHIKSQTVLTPTSPITPAQCKMMNPAIHPHSPDASCSSTLLPSPINKGPPTPSSLPMEFVTPAKTHRGPCTECKTCWNREPLSDTPPMGWGSWGRWLGDRSEDCPEWPSPWAGWKGSLS